MDRLDELSLLAAIIDEGSLIAAGRRLGQSAPAVTRVLAALEQRVGARLIDRTTRRAVPTEQGLRLAERGRALLAEYEAATGMEAGVPLRGLLRVTAPVQFGCRHVSPVVSAFLDAHPGIQVELVLDDRVLDLIAERLDVGVRLSALADSTLVASRLGQVTRLLVASPGYLARHGTPRRLADLAAHDTISRPGRSEAREWRFRTGTVRIAPRLLVTEVEAQRSAAIAGRGIARLSSYQVVDDLAEGSLIRLLANSEPPPVPVYLVTPGGRFMPPKVRAFLDHAVEALRGISAVRQENGSGVSTVLRLKTLKEVHGSRAGLTMERGAVEDFLIPALRVAPLRGLRLDAFALELGLDDSLQPGFIAALHTGRIVGPALPVDELGGEMNHVWVRLGGGQVVEQTRIQPAGSSVW